MRNRFQETKDQLKGRFEMVIPTGDDSHLGGSMSGQIGDPATYYPNLWTWAVGMLEVKSVIDVGCGEGFSLAYFLGLGCDAQGVEGYAASIRKSAHSDRITQHDYEKEPYVPARVFDMAWCCEFVEHVEADKMDHFFATFKQAKVVFMTFAVPGQGGHHHVNEQPAEYWIDAFQRRHFRLSTDLTNAARTVALADALLYSNKMPMHFASKGLVFFNQAYAHEPPALNAN